MRVSFCPNRYDWYLHRTPLRQVVAIVSIVLVSTVIGSAAGMQSNHRDGDRLWLVNTRAISSDAGCINLDQPALDIRRLDLDGQSTKVPVGDYLSAVNESRSVVVYVHGNRMKAHHAVFRGISIYKNCVACQTTGPIDWVIWSWPSEKEGMLTRDVRRKAERTDAQGLYLAWLLRQHIQPSVSTTLIGYSFGGRVVTGSLHALAGGRLGGRSLSGPTLTGMEFGTGLIAPAIDSHWLGERGYHSRATQNMHRLVLMYNRRDAVLKRYWLVDKVRGRMALGYSGPTTFGLRADGSRLPVRSRDCSSSIGLAHDELDYFIKGCRAGSEMATLIDDNRSNL